MPKSQNLKANSRKIWQYRQKYGLTQTELAKVIGIDQSQVSRWESGENQVPISVLKLLDCLEDE